jgi:ribulose-5-phosphate 4-epimerase/fuculose-1-phosphate aldolase
MTSSTHERPAVDVGRAGSEELIRRDLAAFYRLVAMFGWDDMLNSHISARIPGTDHFLLNEHGYLFEEVTASSLVKLDLDGNVVQTPAPPVNVAGVVSHSAILSARPDVQCAAHLHSRHSAAVATSASGLLPLTVQAMSILSQVTVQEFDQLPTDRSRRGQIGRDLGPYNFMLMANHGTTVVGSSIPETFMRTYTLEWACEVQLQILSMGGGPRPTSQAAIDRIVNGPAPDPARRQEGNAAVWRAMLRKLDRVNPGYGS